MARTSVLLIILLSGLLAIPASTRVAEAHGGQLRVDRAPAGPWQVSVFTSPSPARVGTVDISVIPSRPGDEETVPDVQVAVELTPAESDGAVVAGVLSYDAGAGPPVYHAELELPEEGTWRVTVEVSGPDGAGTVEFNLPVEASGGTGWSLWIALVVGAAVLLGLIWVFGFGERDEEPAPGRETGAARRLND